MKSLGTLLAELGDCELARFIKMADAPWLTKQGRESAADWAFGYLAALKDSGRITAEDFDTLASEPRRTALATKPKE